MHNLASLFTETRD